MSPVTERPRVGTVEMITLVVVILCAVLMTDGHWIWALSIVSGYGFYLWKVL